MTNVNILEDGLPQELLNLVGPPKTLRQGRRHVAEQFLYSGVCSIERITSAHLATFRQSFAVIAFVSEDGVVPDGPMHHGDAVFSPGFLKSA
jgi:hypothetical protein